MQGVKIHKDDVPAVIANKIWFSFEVNQSCTVTGIIIDDRYENGVRTVGEEVWRIMLLRDIEEHFSKSRRKRKVLPNSTGAFVAQKLFCYRDDVLNGVHRRVIWRVQ